MVSLAARLVVSGTLLLASWSKLRDPPGFRAGLHEYRLLPPVTEAIVAAVLPLVEVVIAVSLLIDLAPPWPALAAAALFATFSAAIAVAAHRGRDIPCHCFGASEHHRVGAGAVLRGIVLVLMALAVPYAGPKVTPQELIGTQWTAAQALDFVSLVTTLALAVILAEPVVLVVQALPGAWRRRTALAQAEAAERRRCKAAQTANGEVT
jgi:uncharacterized membrane protein YphA (DoxX/SURF4 family)